MLFFHIIKVIKKSGVSVILFLSDSAVVKMNGRQYLNKTLLGIFCLMLFLQSCTTKKTTPVAPPTKPNIVLFLADDMTWSDCEPYGNKDVITPNIQKLANEGMSFDNMFTSTAMCAPTRQQLMTGLYPARSGAFPNHSQVYDGVKSFAHHFKNLGYNVALIGKQHYGPDASFPIDYLGGRQHDTGENGMDIYLEKIEPIINDDKPFFIIIAQNQPHTPWNRGDTSLFDPEKIKIPEYMIDTKKTRDELVKYYAEIKYMDSLLGKTLKYVEKAKKTDNTISIFTSEQGYSFPFGKWTCYDLGLKTAFIAKWPGKIEANSRNNAMTQYVDVIPTLLDLIGESPKDIDTGIADTYGDTGFDGISFSEVLLNGKNHHRDYVYGIQTTRGIINGSESYPIRSIRSNKYLYIQNLSFETTFYNTEVTRPNRIYKNWITETAKKELDWVESYKNRPYEELYDMENDPYEKNNLANNPEMLKVKNELAKKLKLWMLQQGDGGVSTEMEALTRQKKGSKWKSYKEILKNKKQ